MNEQTTSKVPRIRFKGFEGEWEEKTLGEIVLFLDEVRKPLKAGSRKSGRYPYYGASGIIDYVEDYLFSERLILLSEDGANIIDRNYPICFIADGKYWVNNHAHVLKACPGFSDVFIRDSLERLNFEQYNTGTAQPKLNQEVCRNIPLNITEAPEQTQIGGYFRELDSLIGLHQRKHDKLVTLKRAMLQKMFPQPGATTPVIRFKGFSRDWEEKMLGSVANVTTGKLDANAMTSDGIYDFYTSGIKKYKIGIAAFTGPAITIAGNGATVGYMHLADGEFNAYQRTYVLNNFTADRSFLFYSTGIHLPKKISEEARTGNIPYIVMDMLTELWLSIPSPAEQQKIGTYFRTLDELISKHATQLQKLQQIKSACLEKMFV